MGATGGEPGRPRAGEHGIEITALHSHMLGESPRLYFMHFWANDDALTLGTGTPGGARANQLGRANRALANGS